MRTSEFNEETKFHEEISCKIFDIFTISANLLEQIYEQDNHCLLISVLTFLSQLFKMLMKQSHKQL